MTDQMSWEASELGWEPGHFKKSLTYRCETYLYAGADRDAENETRAWYYVNPKTGAKITIFND